MTVLHHYVKTMRDLGSLADDEGNHRHDTKSLSITWHYSILIHSFQRGGRMNPPQGINDFYDIIFSKQKAGTKTTSL